ncbi:hypothetical protein ACX9Z1_003836 [Escherichia coli]|uniref:hypothetical protein n=1 Tax=Escherichia coli TaxID=562 RepID=UPI0002A32853|nr:hypothetical protein [Escherichia coli]EFD0291008.1 hypothetical protein [Escherichia coli]EFN7993753.1 hypothetical protein [Escherichia coli]EGM0668469.1 hypothetical protein [Escherichia coli]EIT7544061.1 hypothetical protein [Escherichia coli]ELD68691.1 hypothetical protein A193_03362 [Escherichia coli KTE234]
MAWTQATLRIPAQLTSLSCSVIPAHPWVPELGQHTQSGGYLSPLNAISYLGKRLLEKGAGSHNIIMMLCENTHSDLLSSLDSVASVLPMPELKQVRRLAQSFGELEQVKMQLPDVLSALPAPINVATETTRQALNAARIEAAKLEAAAAASVSSITTGLAGFLQERTAALADIASAMTELQGKTAKAWFFNMKGPALTTAVELVKNLPHPDAVHTAAILFTGSDLSALEAMIG